MNPFHGHDERSPREKCLRPCAHNDRIARPCIETGCVRQLAIEVDDAIWRKNEVGELMRGTATVRAAYQGLPCMLQRANAFIKSPAEKERAAAVAWETSLR